jgi:hypothetical protein
MSSTLAHPNHRHFTQQTCVQRDQPHRPFLRVQKGILLANSNVPGASNSSFNGTITFSIFWSTSIACQWLNVPLPTSCPDFRMSYPSSMRDPNARACNGVIPHQRSTSHKRWYKLTSAVAQSSCSVSILFNQFFTCRSILLCFSYTAMNYN